MGNLRGIDVKTTRCSSLPISSAGNLFFGATFLKIYCRLLQMEAVSGFEEGGDDGVAYEHVGFRDSQTIVI